MKRSGFIPVQFAAHIGAGAAIVIYCAISGGWQQLGDHWFVALLLAFCGVLEVTLPIIVVRANSKAEFDAGTMFLVAAALLLPTQIATLAWAVGVPLGWAVRREFRLLRIMDAAGEVLACFAALSLAHFIGSTGVSPRNILGAVASGFIFDPVTLLLVALLVWLRGRIHFWPFVKECLVSELPVWPFLVCTGLLLGVLGSTYQWALLLAGAPLALVFLASRARVAASEDRTRLDGLLQATTAILNATEIDKVVEVVTEAASDLLEGARVRIDTEPAGEGDLGAPFYAEGIGELNLIAEYRGTMMHVYDQREHRMLETLASVTGSALTKAAEHQYATSQARLDPLTNLANRRWFENQLHESFVRTGQQGTWGVVAIDLDGFKEINDAYGHQAGDDVLVEVAERLAGCVRGGDMVSRIGGDEFTILVRAVNSSEEIAHVAERVLSSLSRPLFLRGDIELKLTASIGLAKAPDGGYSIDQVLAAADAALYQAKRDGKDCWRLQEVTSADVSASA